LYNVCSSIGLQLKTSEIFETEHSCDFNWMNEVWQQFFASINLLLLTSTS